MQQAFADLDAGDAQRRADCLHSSARVAYQFKKDDERALSEALTTIDDCLALRAEVLAREPEHIGERSIEQFRSQAMKGLLQVQLAVTKLKSLRGSEDAATRTQERSRAYDGSQLIDAALARRQELIPDPRSPDLLRGRYNQAAAAVNLAQLSDDPDEQKRWLRYRVRPIPRGAPGPRHIPKPSARSHSTVRRRPCARRVLAGDALAVLGSGTNRSSAEG